MAGIARHRARVGGTLPLSTLAAPSRDVGTKPQPCSTATEIYDRPGHVGIAPLVDAHRRPLGKTEQLSHTLRVDQVFGIDPRAHPASVPQELTLANHPNSIRSSTKDPGGCANTPGAVAGTPWRVPT